MRSRLFHTTAQQVRYAHVHVYSVSSMYMCNAHAALCICLHNYVITDARHDSTDNAFHNTVPCVAGRYMWCDTCFIHVHLCINQHPYSTSKIVGISTISRPNHPTAQTRELQCTKLCSLKCLLEVLWDSCKSRLIHNMHILCRTKHHWDSSWYSTTGVSLHHRRIEHD